MITVIAPHARPEFSANLLDNFRRQRGAEAQLVVVENGSAVGAVSADEATVICSDAHQADAMNAGLAWLRANGGGPWARFDDDDWYSPDYLADVEREFTAHEVVGKTWGFVMFDDGLYRFGQIEHGAVETCTGGTLAARTADVAPFLPQPDDDVRWCRDMRERGTTIWAGAHRGYCYDRRSRSAPRVIDTSPLVTRWGFGYAEYYGRVPLEFVDAPSAAIRVAPQPTTEELVAEMNSARTRRHDVEA